VNRRWLVAAVVLGAVVSLLLAGVPDDDADALAEVPGQPMPVVDRDDVLTSSWFCATGTASGNGAAELTVELVNLTEEARTGQVTWMPTGAGAPVRQAVELPAGGVLRLPATAAVQAPVVSAVVETDGGGVTVSHTVVGPRVRASAPCASDTSGEWYLANGVTEVDATEWLVLFNPFPDDVVVDVGVDTVNGRVEPPSLQGLPVRARSTAFVNVGDVVRREPVVAAVVRARVGRLVVERLQSFDGSAGRAGSSLVVAARSPAAEWWFPGGGHQAGVTERWHVLNPSDREAQVSLEVVPTSGEPPEPIDLTVAPRAQVIVEAAEAGLPAGVAYHSVVRSLNGVEVVAERSVDSRLAGRLGWSSSPGSPAPATRWSTIGGDVGSSDLVRLVVVNPGAERTEVSILAVTGGPLTPVTGLQQLPLDAAGRLDVLLEAWVDRPWLTFVVAADGPVVVERDSFAVTGARTSTHAGLPVGGG
jgi:hypothetical protein